MTHRNYFAAICALLSMLFFASSLQAQGKPKSVLIMPASFDRVNSSAMTWQQIQKNFYTALEQKLVKQREFSVLNRRRMEAAMAELDLAESEISSPAAANKLGKLLVADWILSTDIEIFEVAHKRRKMAFGERVMETTSLKLTISFRVVEVETQQLLISESYKNSLKAKPVMRTNDQARDPEISIELGESGLKEAAQVIMLAMKDFLAGKASLL